MYFSSPLYQEDIRRAARVSFLPWESLQGESVLITGATGLIGTCLIDILMVNGEAGVVLLQHELQRILQRLLPVNGHDVSSVGHDVPGILVHIPENIPDELRGLLAKLRLFPQVLILLKHLLHPLKQASFFHNLSSIAPFSCLCMKLKADPERFIYLIHQFSVQVTDHVLQSPLVDSADLLQQDDRVLYDPVSAGVNLHMGGQLCLIHAGCDSRTDDCGAVSVPDIVLYDQHRADAALLRPHNGA